LCISEHQTSSTLNEREQQLKDIQLELTKLQEEKDLNEKISNDTINRLKQDYEILKTELQDRGLISRFYRSYFLLLLLIRSYTKYGIK
jgi:hypothetical protein